MSKMNVGNRIKDRLNEIEDDKLGAKELAEVAVGMLSKIRRRWRVLWDEIIKTYDLDRNKQWTVDPVTGELTEKID